MAWKEFEGRPNRVEKNVPRISLNKRGVLRLNSIAYDAIGSPAAVKLLFDEKEQVIGLKPDDIRRVNAFPVKTRRDKARLIHALPFLRHFKIRIERTMLFDKVHIDHRGVVLLPLDKAIGIGRRW